MSCLLMLAARQSHPRPDILTAAAIGGMTDQADIESVQTHRTGGKHTQNGSTDNHDNHGKKTHDDSLLNHADLKKQHACQPCNALFP